MVCYLYYKKPSDSSFILFNIFSHLHTAKYCMDSARNSFPDWSWRFVSLQDGNSFLIEEYIPKIYEKIDWKKDGF